jgi:hypothetical protein
MPEPVLYADVRAERLFDFSSDYSYFGGNDMFAQTAQKPKKKKKKKRWGRLLRRALPIVAAGVAGASIVGGIFTVMRSKAQSKRATMGTPVDEVSTAVAVSGGEKFKKLKEQYADKAEEAIINATTKALTGKTVFDVPADAQAQADDITAGAINKFAPPEEKGELLKNLGKGGLPTGILLGGAAILGALFLFKK